MCYVNLIVIINVVSMAGLMLSNNCDFTDLEYVTGGNGNKSLLLTLFYPEKFLFIVF